MQHFCHDHPEPAALRQCALSRAAASTFYATLSLLSSTLQILLTPYRICFHKLPVYLFWTAG